MINQYNMLRFDELLRATTRDYPDRPAVADFEKCYTYREIDEMSSSFAFSLLRMGIEPGMRIAFLMKNCADWVVAWHAVIKTGSVVVPIHTRITVDRMAENINAARCRVLIYGASLIHEADQLMELCPDLKTRIVVRSPEKTGPGIRRMEDLARVGTPYVISPDVGGDDPCLILFTSGTTGREKGVVRTHQMMVLHALLLALGSGKNATDTPEVMMSTSPLYHTGGLQGMLKMLVLGGLFITLNGIRAEEIERMTDQYQVTQLQMLPPVMYERIYDYMRERGRVFPSVREVCVSAGKADQKAIGHIFEMFPNCHLRVSWGSTETCNITNAWLMKEDVEKDPSLIRSVGYVLPTTEIRLVDSTGQEVKDGEIGEAYVRSPMVAYGYLDRPDLLDVCFSPGGWFRTGDLMHYNPKNHQYYFVDRIKDMIKTGGENVFASEVESALSRCPEIRECAVVGLPDPTYGEGIAAAVVLNPGCELSPEKLISFCRRVLPGYKKPRYLAVMESLPRNDVGKVAKQVLRDMGTQMFKPLF